MESFETYAQRVISGLEDSNIQRDEIQSIIPSIFAPLSDIPCELTPIDPEQESFDLPRSDYADKDSETQVVGDGIISSGIEALAFYKSIHFLHEAPFPGKWGIFILDYGIRYIADGIDRHYPGKYTPPERDALAFKLLYFHERFHYRFDSWVLSIESATAKPLYLDYQWFYNKFLPTGCPIYEESLANLHALSCVTPLGIYSYARQFMLGQPGSYADIINVDQADYRGRLAAQLFHGNSQFLGVPAFTLPEHAEFLAQPKNPKKSDRWCPTYVITGVTPSRILKPIRGLPKLSEVKNGFLRKYLNGREDRTDHSYFRIDNGAKVKCPNPHEKEVRDYEFSDIIRKAGISVNEYFEERSKTGNWRKNVPRKEVKPPLPN